MKKRLFSGLMALLLVAGIACGCAAPASEEPESGEIIDLGGLDRKSVV